MTRTCPVLAFLLTLIFNAQGMPGKAHYPIHSIPPALLENAHAVVRLNHTSFTLFSEKTARETHHLVVSVLKPEGDAFASFTAYYNSFSKVLFHEGAVYHGSGQLHYKVKYSDIKDLADQESSNLYSDNRKKQYVPNMGQYPYTVEYVWDVEYSGLLNYPSWYPLYAKNLSIGQQEHVVRFPADMDIRVKEYNTTHEYNQEKSGKIKVYTWKSENLPAIKREAFDPSSWLYTPFALIAPRAFSLDGYPGDMSSWESFGKWVYDLLPAKEQLSVETRQALGNLVAGIGDPLEKAKKIYRFMQGKCRYVNVNEGIGGWRPTPALQVDRNGYGDCKALVNYTRALLETAGVTAYYALVHAGPDPDLVPPDFPGNWFNHAILCVPLDNDTAWLECTSAFNPFGFIAGFTDRRPALLIKEGKGVLVKTRTYTAEENCRKRHAVVTITGTGHATACVTTEYQGLYYTDIEDQLTANPEQQRKAIYKELTIQDAGILAYSYTSENDQVPKVTEILSLDIQNFASGRERRYFMPMLLDRWKTVPSQTDTRKHGFKLQAATTEYDSILFILPENTRIESLPASESMRSPCGSYACNITASEDKILYVRKLVFYAGFYPPGEFQAFAAFLRKVAVKDEKKVVLLAQP